MGRGQSLEHLTKRTLNEALPHMSCTARLTNVGFFGLQSSKFIVSHLVFTCVNMVSCSSKKNIFGVFLALLESFQLFLLFYKDFEQRFPRVLKRFIKKQTFKNVSSLLALAS